MRAWLIFSLFFVLSLALPSAALLAQDAPKEAAAADPADAIVIHMQEMARIVKDNLDQPEEVKKNLAAYLRTNQRTMRSAGDNLEAHIAKMRPDEQEAYREVIQRKMEKALDDFLTAMLDFAERHPEAAKELDEMLRLDQN